MIPDYHHKQQQSQRKAFVNFIKKPNKTCKGDSYEHESIFLHCFFLSLLKITAKRVESQSQRGRQYMKKKFLKKESNAEYIKSS